MGRIIEIRIILNYYDKIQSIGKKFYIENLHNNLLLAFNRFKAFANKTDVKKIDKFFRTAQD